MTTKMMEKKTGSISTEVTERFNGLPLPEFSKVPEMLESTPEEGMLTFATRTLWKGGMRSTSEVDGFEVGKQRFERRHLVESDEPAQLFGRDEAPNPQEILFAGLGACLSATYAMQATSRGIRLRSLVVELRGTLDLRGSVTLKPGVPPGYPEVSFRVHVAADASPEEIRALHEACLRASPNFYHLTESIPARTQLVIER